MRELVLALRVGGAIAIFAALTAQLINTVNFESAGAGHTAFVAVNFFSFFTVESNLIAAAVLATAAAYSLGSLPEPAWLGPVRAAATTYMVTTGVVYNLLLRGVELPIGSVVAWSNEILHVAGPVIVALDWLVAPGRRRLPPRTLAGIVVFPIAWAAYTLVRGALTIDPRTDGHWYPYPFLNPGTSANGYASVAFYILLIAAVICVVGSGVVRIGAAARERAAAEDLADATEYPQEAHDAGAPPTRAARPGQGEPRAGQRATRE
ncbi:Pr6Pr family membrane protein [Zafaria sp. J156]|uniref:Pr6Pr family membrane protein n=1 Tax=Zafaria sp. J156 TaxID=3116490 RepID=UPI002E769489|nr:Pr6Pr family membrane protein [Zafaria sp. J156]MEE1619808.1 Pr6Pr family membrane protein [Zafaria sp. J156]